VPPPTAPVAPLLLARVGYQLGTGLVHLQGAGRPGDPDRLVQAAEPAAGRNLLVHHGERRGATPTLWTTAAARRIVTGARPHVVQSKPWPSTSG